MEERLSHGAPTFFVRGKRPFVMVLTDHHGDGRFALWCAAGEGVQQMLVDADPERFFVPPYVGHRGWLGVDLNKGVDWNELAGIAEDAFAEVAPAKLVAAAAAAGAGRALIRAGATLPGQHTYGGAPWFRRGRFSGRAASRGLRSAS